MKKLSIEEVGNLEFFKEKPDLIFNEVETLEIGEGLFVATGEYPYQSSFSSRMNNYGKKLNREFKSKTVETGYYVIRIK